MDARDRLPADLQRETDALRRIARGVLFEPALAEDAVQEAWLAALRSPADGPRTGGWLTEAVRRIASGMRREEARRARRQHAAAQHEAQPSAADSAARVELLRELLDALEALDEPYQSAVQLRLVDDLPPRAIAERLGIPVETARTRVKRGIEKLRAGLDARNAHRRGEFLAALAPLALPTGWKLGVGAYVGSKTILGGWMSTQAKLAAAAALLLVTGLCWWQPWSTRANAVPRIASAESPAATSPALEVVASPSAETPIAQPEVQPEAHAGERRVGAAPAGDWVLRGRALKDRKQPFPGAEIELELVAGYDGAGEILARETVHAVEDGSFALALARPEQALRVRSRGKMQGFLSYTGETLVLRGAEPPRELLVGFLTLDVQLVGRVLDPQGAPIRGAELSGPGRRTAKTDASGAFVLEGCSTSGSVLIDAWAEGYAETRTSLTVHGPGRVEDIEIRLAPWRVLHGRVSDENGRAIAGARVRCFPLARPQTQSGSDGSFTLTGLPSHPTWLSVGVEAEGFARLRHALRAGELPSGELALVLQRGVELSGVVCDEAGRGLPGAELYVGDSAFDVDTLKTVAGDEGRFVFRGVPRAAQGLHAEHAGFAPTDVALTLPEHGGPAPLRVELGAGLSVRGVVVDAGALPVAGLTVIAKRDGEYVDAARANTGSDGRFLVEHLPRDGKLALELYGDGFVRREVPLDARSSEDLRIVLTRAAGLAGRVLDAATGSPVTAFRVRLVPGELKPGEQPLTGYGASWIETGHEFRDADGRWDTQGDELSPDQLTGIEVLATGYGPAFVARARTRVDPAAEPIEIRLSRAVSLRGRVLDKQRGMPVAGAQVRRILAREARGSWFPGDGDAASAMRTDANGEFRFDGLALEPLSLAVDAPGFAPVLDGPFEPGPSTRERTIELSGGATLRCRLLDAEGRPRPHEAVMISAGGGAMGKLMRDWTRETDAEGRFGLDDLMPAEYSAAVTLRHEHGAVYDLGQSVSIRDAGTYTLELRPRGSGRITGRLQTSDNPSTLATVQASRAGGNGWRAAIARDGRFVLEGLEAGRWQLSVYEPGSPSESRHGRAEVDLAEGRESDVTIELERR